MQDKDADVLLNQRRRRKRIARMRTGVIVTIAGWIVLSMILIVVLFVRVSAVEKQLDQVTEDLAAVSGEVSVQDGEEPLQGAWDPVTPTASGISEEENLASEGDVHKVYLTFNDGPSEHTAEILDLLAERNVKATFFVTGTEDEALVPLYQRIVDEGHTLGMHSYANKYNVLYESEDAFEQDYQKLRDYLKELTGKESMYYRFPGGSSNRISNVPMEYFIHYLNTQGIVYYDWNVMAGDASSSAYAPEEIVENVMGDVVKYKTSVVLLHDSAEKSATAEAVGALIDALEGIGAQILPIDENTQVIQSVKADMVE